MILLIMGPQGSGKSTQGKLLAEKYNLPFISLGRVLRTLKEENDAIGLDAAKYWETGELVSDELIRKVVDQYFSKHDVPNGFIMDGFPRYMKQYRWMHEVFPGPVDAVIYLHIGHDEIMRRLEKRRTIENRVDETPEAIAERLKEYEENTIPVIQDLVISDIPFIKVDGEQSIEDIHTEIVQELGINKVV